VCGVHLQKPISLFADAAYGESATGMSIHTICIYDNIWCDRHAH
jgi:hypothetical protein